MRLILTDRWGTQLGTLSDLISATWTEELSGTDSLELEGYQPVSKGDRVVWLDAQGLWHEHIVAEVEQAHESGAVTYRAACECSISETYGDWIDDLKPRDATAASALASVLRSTRWEVGAVEVEGAHSKNFYRESAREALQELVEAWGGELSCTVEVEGCAVTARRVNLTHRGRDNGRRFEWGRDMTRVTRTVSADDVVTALYGYGKGEEVGDGYGRAIDFADINGGKAYVEDADALELWGRPDAGGGKAHVFGKFEDGECEDKARLLEETRAELARRCVPQVSYEATVAALADYGYDFAGVALGDTVRLIDRGFAPEVRVMGRVTRLVRDMLDGGRVTELAVGNVVAGADGLIADQYASVKALERRSGAWDVAASTPSGYIDQVMDGLNRRFDAGASYVYQSASAGIIVSDVPLDPETGLPTRLPASAIQLKAGGFRIASSLKGDGSWDWRTAGTGGGLTADVVTAGTIRGGKSWWNLADGSMSFEQGTIASADGSSSWDLTNGTMVLKGGLTIGGGIIQSADGRNRWDLDTGDLTVSGGVFSSRDGDNVIDMDSGTANLGGEGNVFDGGVIRSGNNYWDLNTGEMQLDFTPSGELASSIDGIRATANAASSNAASAKLKTDRITFTSAGMQITGSNGKSQQVATYTADGFAVDAETCTIGSSAGALTVKDRGLYFEGRTGTKLWATDGARYGGGPHFRAVGDGFDLMAATGSFVASGNGFEATVSPSSLYASGSGWAFAANSSGVYYTDGNGTNHTIVEKAS